MHSRFPLAQWIAAPRLSLALLVAAISACASDARLTAPDGAAAFRTFVVIGTGLSMGEQGAGVLYETQIAAWPSRLAARMDATFRVPAFRQPGCTPPLVAPLQLYRNLSGSIDPTAAGCSGRLGSDSLPANNVAMSGATAWDALHISPRTFVTQEPSLNQIRYALVLPMLGTQVTSMQGLKPTLVAVELGATEVMRAAWSGLVTVGTSYSQKTAWTLMPASVFTPVFDSIADSVAATGARAVFLGVPQVMSLPAWRAGDVLWQQRTQLAAYGVIVATDCQASTNLVNTVAKLPPLVAAARDSSKTKTLSCADVAGTADGVLTAADAALITQTVTAINAAIKAAADKRSFAYVDVPVVSSAPAYAAPAFSAATFLGTDAPFGRAISLDGVLPSAVGHELVADAVAAALNTKYGWSIAVGTSSR